MTIADDDPRCPECGGPIGQTATYCMHCSADLTTELEAADIVTSRISFMDARKSVYSLELDE